MTTRSSFGTKEERESRLRELRERWQHRQRTSRWDDAAGASTGNSLGGSVGTGTTTAAAAAGELGPTASRSGLSSSSSTAAGPVAAALGARGGASIRTMTTTAMAAAAASALPGETTEQYAARKKREREERQAELRRRTAELRERQRLRREAAAQAATAAVTAPVTARTRPATTTAPPAVTTSQAAAVTQARRPQPAPDAADDAARTRREAEVPSPPATEADRLLDDLPPKAATSRPAPATVSVTTASTGVASSARWTPVKAAVASEAPAKAAPRGLLKTTGRATAQATVDEFDEVWNDEPAQAEAAADTARAKAAADKTAAEAKAMAAADAKAKQEREAKAAADAKAKAAADAKAAAEAQATAEAKAAAKAAADKAAAAKAAADKAAAAKTAAAEAAARAEAAKEKAAVAAAATATRTAAAAAAAAVVVTPPSPAKAASSSLVAAKQSKADDKTKKNRHVSFAGVPKTHQELEDEEVERLLRERLKAQGAVLDDESPLQSPVHGGGPVVAPGAGLTFISPRPASGPPSPASTADPTSPTSPGEDERGEGERGEGEPGSVQARLFDAIGLKASNVAQLYEVDEEEEETKYATTSDEESQFGSPARAAARGGPPAAAGSGGAQVEGGARGPGISPTPTQPIAKARAPAVAAAAAPDNEDDDEWAAANAARARLEAAMTATGQGASASSPSRARKTLLSYEAAVDLLSGPGAWQAQMGDIVRLDRRDLSRSQRWRISLLSPCGCGGPNRDLPTAELRNERDFVLCLARTPVDAASADHDRLLEAVYGRLTGELSCPRLGPHWEVVGFQGRDPATDVRGAGLFALVQLLALVDVHHPLAHRIWTLSRDDRQNFPFAAVSVNLSMFALSVLRSGLLFREARRRRSVLEAVNALHAAAFLRLFLQWKSKGLTIEHFPLLRTIIRKEMHMRPDHMIEELEAYVDPTQRIDEGLVEHDDDGEGEANKAGGSARAQEAVVHVDSFDPAYQRSFTWKDNGGHRKD